MTNDKIVNTRVSGKLYDKIALNAKKNRITVSNFIRNLVEDTLDIHEDIHEAFDKKIRKYLSNKANYHNILGFQEITLAKNTSCDNCGRQLKASDSAYLTYFDNSDEKSMLCSICKLKYSKATKDGHEDNANS